jgi:cytochrome c biogenesis protein
MKLLRSIQFNVALFGVIAGASALGTFLPQRGDAPEAVSVFRTAHPALGPLLDRLGFFGLYQAPWYLALLALMAVDVVACKLRSLPRNVHGEAVMDERLIAASPLKEARRLERSWVSSIEAVRELLRRSGFALRERREGRDVYFWAGKHRLQRWGDFLLHVSVVAILAGGFIGGRWGFSEVVPVEEGGARPLVNRPWTVALDAFHVETYPETGQARSFVAEIHVSTGAREIARGRVAVNHPLDIDGVRIYQASWGHTGALRSATLALGDGSKELVLPFRRRTPLPGTDLTVSADVFVPDFSLSPEGRPASLGVEPRNPALLVRFYKGNDVPWAGVWLVRDSPVVSYKEQGDGTVEAAPHPPFRLAGFDPVVFSGLQIAYDPGARLAGWGSVALLAGLCLHFYLHQRRVRVLVRAREDGATDVFLGGWNSRRVMDFEEEFRDLARAVERLNPETAP